MKRYAAISLILLLLVPSVSADVGIGIKWNTEWKKVAEGTKTCISYGLYNPFDTDVMGYLTATKDLKGIHEAEEAKLVPAGTRSDDSIPTDLCFNIPKVYEEDCLLLGMLCEKKCEEPKKWYKGEVLASYNTLTPGGGVGSSTGSSFAVPLELEVRCEAYARDLTPLYALAVVVVALVVLYIMRKKKKI